MDNKKIRLNFEKIMEKREVIKNWSSEKLSETMGDLDKFLAKEGSSKETKSLENCMNKREQVLNELYITEGKYIEALNIALNLFKAEMDNPNSSVKKPENLTPDKEKLIFSNIQAIYEWHRDIFLKCLEEAKTKPETIGTVLQTHKRKLQMYVTYFSYKPLSEIVVETFDDYFEKIRNKIGAKDMLATYLICPIQRLPRYKMLLKEILDCTSKTSEERSGIEKSFNIITELIEYANNMMDANRIEKFDGKLSSQGKLVLRDYIDCMEQGRMSRFKEMKVFLFENSIIFTEVMKKPPKENVYCCKAHITMNKLELKELDSKKFKVTLNDPKKKEKIEFTCQMNSQENYEMWIKAIKSCLACQNDWLQKFTEPEKY